MEENGENNYTLTIHSIRERNLGNYTCQAVNKIGDGSSTIALKGRDIWTILVIWMIHISTLFGIIVDGSLLFII